MFYLLIINYDQNETTETHGTTLHQNLSDLYMKNLPRVAFLTCGKI